MKFTMDIWRPGKPSRTIVPKKVKVIGAETFPYLDMKMTPSTVIHSSLRLIRHIKRIVQHPSGLDMAASHAILGWERLAITGCFALHDSHEL